MGRGVRWRAWVATIAIARQPALNRYLSPQIYVIYRPLSHSRPHLVQVRPLFVQQVRVVAVDEGPRQAEATLGDLAHHVPQRGRLCMVGQACNEAMWDMLL